MKVLVIGSGGRCHAICDSLKKSPKVTKIYAAPGNAGMSSIATLVNIKETDVSSLLDFAIKEKIYLTVVGPEVALAAGVVNRFNEMGLRIFGPTKEAARIESSKQFAKDLMKKYNIPTAQYETFTDYAKALNYIMDKKPPYVLKYDGLAAGKGVVIANDLNQAKQTLADMLLNSKFGEGKVVIEDFLTGEEFSFMCLVDNDKVYPLELAQDHKRAFENNEGPNTGGMGCFSPLPFVTKEDKDFAIKEIIQKTANALIKEGYPFKGVLYGGLMKTPDGIKVIEFNARFGDPETEVILPRLESDIFDVFCNIVDGKEVLLKWKDEMTVGIVLASKGYPEDYKKGYEINIGEVKSNVYHMGTTIKDDKLVTNGGRVLIVVGMAKTLIEARNNALEDIKNIKCENLFFRKDIGTIHIKEEN